MPKRSRNKNSEVIEQNDKLIEKDKEKDEAMTWTDPLISKLIDHYSCILYNSTSDSNIKSAEWTKVLNNFNEETKLNCNRQQLQSKIQSLKKQWIVFKKMKENSGWGWDHERNIPTAQDDVWAAYIKAHPEAKEFRYQSLPLFDKLDELF